MPTFDLRIEPWIPVVDAGGELHAFGLADVLKQAHQLREIRDPLPTAEFGMYRLLVALVMDMFPLTNTRQLERRLQAGGFDPEVIDAYFTQWQDRFDLFHPQHPFLQSADMGNEPDKPLAGLLAPLPSGTNARHFHHALETEFAVCPSAAARLLTTIAPFMTAGGAGLAPSINGAPPWYGLVTGRNLFETLCLNCCTVPLRQGNDGIPTWRGNGRIEAGRRQSATLLEGLTWQPRRILLVPGAGGLCALTCRQSDILIRAMKFGAGYACDFAWTDPNVPYKQTQEGALVLRPQEERAVWRDIAPLALLHDRNFGRDAEKVTYSRPAVIDQFADLTKYDDNALGYQTLELTLYGMRTDLKMKVFEWHKERLSLPRQIVLNENFHRVAQLEMERAGDVAFALRQAIKKAYPRDGKSNKKAFDVLIGHAQQRFWNDLEPHYWRLLHEIAGLSPETQSEQIEARRSEWKAHLKRVGEAALEEVIDALDTDAKQILRAQVQARKEFFNRTYTQFASPEELAARKERKNRSKGGQQP